MKKRQATIEELKQIANLYLKGKSQAASAKKFGYGQKVAIRALKVFEIKSRTISEAHFLNDYARKYLVDKTFFEKIDTPEKAYWLGFISADGWVCDQNKLSIELKNTDENHLKKFKKNIKSAHPITQRKNRDACLIQIGSRKIVQDLKKMGITPNKSLILKSCQLVPEHLLKDYWRGFIDGDGSIHIDRKNWRINLTGAYEICKDFDLFLHKKLNTNTREPNQKNKTKNTFLSIYGGNIQIKKICSLLYENSSVYLDRKYKLAKNIFEKDDFLLGKSLTSLQAKGFKKNLGVGIVINKKYRHLGTYKTPQQAFVAHKSAWFKIYVENCEDVDTIKEYTKQSAQNPNEWIEEMKKREDLKEVMENYILPAYSKL